jgi:hypothetical protein
MAGAVAETTDEFAAASMRRILASNWDQHPAPTPAVPFAPRLS